MRKKESLNSGKLKVPLSLLFTPVTNRVLINVRHWRKPILNILTLWCFIGAINRPLWGLTGRPISLLAFPFAWQINQGTRVHVKTTAVALTQAAAYNEYECSFLRLSGQQWTGQPSINTLRCCGDRLDRAQPPPLPLSSHLYFKKVHLVLPSKWGVYASSVI